METQLARLNVFIPFSFSAVEGDDKALPLKKIEQDGKDGAVKIWLVTLIKCSDGKISAKFITDVNQEIFEGAEKVTNSIANDDSVQNYFRGAKVTSSIDEVDGGFFSSVTKKLKEVFTNDGAKDALRKAHGNFSQARIHIQDARVNIHGMQEKNEQMQALIDKEQRREHLTVHFQQKYSITTPT